MKKRIKFIVNPISGHHNKNKFPNLVDLYIDKTKYDYSIAFTEHVNHASELTLEAIKEGYEYIGAVGGDGTINEIAKCLINKDQTLIIVPQGSGNGLARHLKLPLRIERLIKEVVNNGTEVKIDTATMNDVPFLSVAGIGFDAQIADFFAKDPKRGFITYAKLITEIYPNFKPKNYKLILDDGRTIECKPFFITFANSNQFGYNAEISPKASVQDGLLDVCVFKKPNIIEAPLAATLLMTKNIDKSNFIEIYKTRTARVIRNEEEVVNIDGEAIFMGKEISVKVNPLSIKILLSSK